MIQIASHYITRAKTATSPEDLFDLLQKAIELEHATIPAYLTAMISLKPGQNREIWRIIHSVVIEEMLHLAIVANILNALGGQPQLNKPGFVPHYPGPLPMSIGSKLIVGLEPYSKDLIKNTFMVIEEPESPLVFPIHAERLVAAPMFATIGQFYQAIQESIGQLPFSTMPGNPARQVVNPHLFPVNKLFAINTTADAQRAIAIIVEQGEGTQKSPLDSNNELAHYYRFEELYIGRRLVADPTSPKGYSFSGSKFPFDPNGVYPLQPNTKLTDLPVGTEQRQQAEYFTATYATLLNGLHRTFNGDPAFLESTLGLMYDLKLTGEKLAGMPHPGQPGHTVGPPFDSV